MSMTEAAFDSFIKYLLLFECWKQLPLVDFYLRYTMKGVYTTQKNNLPMVNSSTDWDHKTMSL